MSVDDVATLYAIVAIAWAIFVVAFMISIWSHLAALRRRHAPQQEPIHWEVSGDRYRLGVPLAQPMYAIWERDHARPVAVFPFSMDGKDAALARLHQLQPSSEPQQ